MKKVGIIIINYKDYAEKFLVECRDSLRSQDFKSDFKVYIVDNASTDESLKYLKDSFKEAKVISREEGNYTAGNNAGIKKAREDGCEYFVIANMDMKFEKNWLSELVIAIETDDKIGIAQSKILLYQEDDNTSTDSTGSLQASSLQSDSGQAAQGKINTLGNIIHFLGFGFTENYKEDDREIEDLKEIKGYASGASFIIKKEVLNRIGGYNEEYYMYHDDLEMGWKTRLAGYKIVLASKSICYHKYEFSRSVRMLYYMERNRYMTFFIFYHFLTILLLMPALLIMDLGMLFYSIVNGWFVTKVRIYFYFLNLNNWKKIIKERRKIQKMRKLKDRDVVKDFYGKVLFQEINNPVLQYIANPLFNLYWNIAKKLIIW